MRVISKARLAVGNFLFHCQNGLGRYRVNSSGRRPLAVLMYHGLETDPRRLAASGHRVTPDGCLKEIRFFQRQGYQLISAREIDSLENRLEQESAGYLLVSFDDGHANIFPYVKKWMEAEKIPVLLGICPGIVEANEIYWWEEVRARFEIMREPSVRIESPDGSERTFGKSDAKQFEETARESTHQELQSQLEQLRRQTGYIEPQQLRISAYVHENMNWQQIVELSRNPLCTLASHSMRHEIATRVPPDELRRLTRTSLELLEAKTGRRPQHYVYPNGMFSEETENVLGELGIRHTYTTEGFLNPIPAAIQLNRLNGYDFGNRSMQYYGALWKKRHWDYLCKVP